MNMEGKFKQIMDEFFNIEKIMDEFFNTAKFYLKSVENYNDAAPLECSGNFETFRRKLVSECTEQLQAYVASLKLVGDINEDHLEDIYRMAWELIKYNPDAQTEEEIKCLSELIKLNPNKYEYYERRGQLYYSLADDTEYDNDDCDAQYIEYVEYIDVKLDKNRYECSCQNFTKALADFEKVITLNSSSSYFIHGYSIDITNVLEYIYSCHRYLKNWRKMLEAMVLYIKYNDYAYSVLNDFSELIAHYHLNAKVINKITKIVNEMIAEDNSLDFLFLLRGELLMAKKITKQLTKPIPVLLSAILIHVFAIKKEQVAVRL